MADEQPLRDGRRATGKVIRAGWRDADDEHPAERFIVEVEFATGEAFDDFPIRAIWEQWRAELRVIAPDDPS